MNDSPHNGDRCFGLTEHGLSALAASIADAPCRVRLHSRLDAGGALLWDRGLILLDPARASLAQLFYLATIYARVRESLQREHPPTAPSRTLLASAYRDLKVRYPGLAVPRRRKELTAELTWSPDSAPLRPARRDLAASNDGGRTFQLIDFGTNLVDDAWEQLMSAIDVGQVQPRFLRGFDDVPYAAVPLELPSDQHLPRMQERFTAEIGSLRHDIEGLKRCFAQRNSGDPNESFAVHHRQFGDEVDPELLHDVIVSGFTGQTPAVFIDVPDPPIEEFDPERSLTVYALDLSMLAADDAESVGNGDDEDEDEDEDDDAWSRRPRHRPVGAMRIPVASILLAGQAMHELGVPFEIHGYLDTRLELGGRTWLIHVQVPILRESERWDEDGLARLGRLVAAPLQLPGEPMSFSPLQIQESLARIETLKARREVRWTFYTHMTSMPLSTAALEINDYAERSARSLHEQFEAFFAADDNPFHGLFFLDPWVVRHLPEGSRLEGFSKPWSLGGLSG